MTYPNTQPGQYPPPPPGFYQPPKKSRTGRTVLIVIGSCLGGIILLGIVAAAITSAPVRSTGSNAASNPPVVSTSPAATPVAQTSAPASTAPPRPHYTVAQRQALQSAEGYLSDGQGFSRSGLIQQLDSPYGDQFSHRLALFAVNHVRVNWFHQAVISARGYMSDGEGFSYSSLVSQLDSSYGEAFTYAQAVYAANKVFHR
jgi:hypothetical protein